MSCDVKPDESVIGILRADGNESIGSGHVMRTLALAQSIKDIGKLVFVTNITTPSALLNRFSQSGINSCVLNTSADEEEVDLLRRYYPQAAFIVTDGYDFSEAYHDALKSSGFRVARIVDFANRHYIADLIINHSPGIRDEDYSKDNAVPLCLGLDFALLQPAFIAKAKKPVENIKNKHLFINIGGADPDNVTIHLLTLLENISWDGEINVVAGKLNPYQEELVEFTRGSKNKIHIHIDLTAESIINLLDVSNMAICSASTIAIEACACRVPLLIGCAVDNQELIYNGLVEQGMAVGLGKFSQINREKLEGAISYLGKNNFAASKLMRNMQEKRLSGNSEENFMKVFRSLLASE